MRDLPELLVIRHGETEWNRAGRWQGAFDSPLTARGEAQAAAMGRLLAGMGVGPATHGFETSPQGRATETARLILAECGPGSAILDPRLREIGVGTFAGRLRDDIAAEVGHPPGAPFLDLYARAPRGEAFADLHARVTDYLASLTRPTVIVTHGITSRFLRTAALGLGPDRLGELPGGQGVVHRIADGQHRTFAARDGAIGDREGLVDDRAARTWD